MNFSERLKMVRGNIHQKRFAEMLDVHVNTLGRWERGEQCPNQQDICKILQIRPSINPEWILTGEGPMERTADPKPANSAKPVNLSLLKDVIAAVEDHLASKGLKLVSEKKAELITVLYDMFAEKNKVDKAVVLSLVKLAA
jgi:transcriptional regulator with XRE-family HTH domain